MNLKLSSDKYIGQENHLSKLNKIKNFFDEQKYHDPNPSGENLKS